MRLMWTDNEREKLLRAIDSLEGSPDANPAARWVYGVVLPALALVLSVLLSIRGTWGAGNTTRGAGPSTCTIPTTGLPTAWSRSPSM